jgi:exo-1,4-beta-D-glucosaminidase
MAAYFGTKVGARMEHVAYDYEHRSVWLINHSLKNEGQRQVLIDVIDTHGRQLSGTKVSINTTPNSAKPVSPVDTIQAIQDVAFLRLILRDPKSDMIISRNVYWVSQTTDVLDWSKSNFFTTPVTTFANYTKLQFLSAANVKASLRSEIPTLTDALTRAVIQLENKSEVPAFFIRLNAIHASEEAEIAPIYWSDNYVTLWPKEKLSVTIAFHGNPQQIIIEASGQNVERVTMKGAEIQQ